MKRVLIESMPFDPDLKLNGGGGGGGGGAAGGGGGGRRGERLAGHISRMIVSKSRSLVRRDLSSSLSADAAIVVGAEEMVIQG